MQISHWITGTVSIPPGTDAARVLDLPAGFSEDQLPNEILTRVWPSDPTNLGLFKLHYFSGAGSSESTRDSYAGVHQIWMTYTLTGTAPINVDFALVFTDENPPARINYQGV